MIYSSNDGLNHSLGLSVLFIYWSNTDQYTLLGFRTTGDPFHNQQNQKRIRSL